MSGHSLQDAINRSGNFVESLRNNRVGAYTFPVVPPEFHNWRDEQLAWHNSVALLDLTHHMTYLYMRGSNVVELLSQVGANSFKGFCVDKAKQIICCSPQGDLIGDGILFYLAENYLLYVGRPIAANWIQFQAELLGLDVEFIREAKSPSHTMGHAVTRSVYRYSLQGPLALDLIAKLNGGSPPEIKFFNMGYMTIAGRAVRALHHGMAGTPGLEIWGPYGEREDVRSAILNAGEEFGIVPVGSRAYPTTALEAGWIPSALPAIYTDPSLRGYREWLNEDCYEATCSLGGSFMSKDIQDYYLTPFELGYGNFIKFDHEFIGREALQAMDPSAQRRRVTFEWSNDSVAKVFASIMDPPGENYKYIEMPLSIYSSHDYDAITLNGIGAGVSLFSGFNYYHRKMLSLGVVLPDVEIGSEVSLLWGEPDGGTRKTTVERHKQTEIRAIVRAAPYSQVAREEYRPAVQNPG